MFLDALLKLVDTQAVTVSAPGNNVIDTGVGGRDLTVGEGMSILIAVAVSAVGTGTYSFRLQTATDAAFTTPVDVGGATTIAPADLTAGKTTSIPFPAGTLLRYIRLYITTGGTSPGLTMSAFIQPSDMLQRSKDYPKGYLITG